MAKIKLTRPELKKQRDSLRRFERYLPMLKLKQQQLQLMVRQAKQRLADAQDEADAAHRAFEPYRRILADRAGVNVEGLAEPTEISTAEQNVAGVRIPVYESTVFPEATYSLFATPAWVDRTLLDLRHLAEGDAKLDVMQRQLDIIDRELTKIVQRVNLFEKVKIPDSREAIRRIRIKLGDEMTAAVGRAKIAKGKITRSEQTVYSETDEAAP